MRIFIIFCFLCLSHIAQAVVEYHAFAQPEQEQAYLSIISELRCLVCQNQTIADSNADLAKDLRQQVYEMLEKGQSKQQIIDFMTDRYGDFVLYNPALKLKTALLWLGPIAFLLIGLITVVIIARKRKQASQIVSLSPEQQTQLQHLLEPGDQE